MLDTGKDAIDVTATVTAKVGEEAVNKGTQVLVSILKLLLKLLQAILQKVADKVANRNGMRKVETLSKDGDSTTFIELPAGLDQKEFQKQMHKQGKKLAFQFSLTKSGDNCILTFKDKDAQVVALAYKNLQREAINKNKVLPDIEMPNTIQVKEQQQEKGTKESFKPQYEPIKVSRDQEGNFVYSRGDLSITSKGEKGEVVRQRLQDTFGISEKSAWAVWNQGLNLSKNEKVAKRRSIRENISKAQAKQQAAIQASKQSSKTMTQSTPTIAPAAGMAR
jgi:hypothetical protein